MIDLVYVASIGRSGSTLLESMLGAHTAMATTGEVHVWPHEIVNGGVRACGSGKFVTEDPFWLEMKRRVDPLNQPSPRIHAFREMHDAGRTLRLKRLGEFSRAPISETTRTQIRQYGRNNYDLFQAFLDLVEEQTGRRPEWVVDASKDPYRLLWLIRCGQFRIKVIHVVKNPRGFAYSLTKHWLDSHDPFRDLKRLYYTARQSLAWVLQNDLLSHIATNHLNHEDYLLVKYEDFASKPYETFQQICDVIGCRYEKSAVDDFRFGSPYSIAGNPMRYKTGGIYLDEEWKDRLPKSSRRLAEIVTRVNRARFGYA